MRAVTISNILPPRCPEWACAYQTKVSIAREPPKAAPYDTLTLTRLWHQMSGVAGAKLNVFFFGPVADATSGCSRSFTSTASHRRFEGVWVSGGDQQSEIG